MKFTKMQGAGNDFILLNLVDKPIQEARLSAIARRLCSRRSSIGADGLLAVAPARAGGDYRMLFYNADGSAEEMCGNGARCIARFGHDLGLAGEMQRIETPSGLVTGWRVTQRDYKIRLTDPTVMKLDYPVTLDGVTYPCAYVELGTPGLPHAVVRLDSFDHMDRNALRELGRKLRFHPAFPRGANVNFWRQVGENRIKIRTFERGVEDFTLACGTGSGSTAAALTLQGLVNGRGVEILQDGGTLTIDVTQRGGRVTELLLTGPTNLVCQGEVLDEELEECL